MKELYNLVLKNSRFIKLWHVHKECSIEYFNMICNHHYYILFSKYIDCRYQKNQIYHTDHGGIGEFGLEYIFSYFCRTGNYAMVKQMMKDGIVNIHHGEENPFRQAVAAGNMKIVKLFLKNDGIRRDKVDINADSSGAFIFAVNADHKHNILKMIKLLLSLGTPEGHRKYPHHTKMIQIDTMNMAAFRYACVQNLYDVTDFLISDVMCTTYKRPIITIKKFRNYYGIHNYNTALKRFYS